MISAVEIVANALNAISIVLAAKNSLHTWWTGIAGCSLFGWLFYGTRLYADVTLQIFFIGTCILGWWNWQQTTDGRQKRIRSSRPLIIMCLLTIAILAALLYGAMLHCFTDAFAPFWDSMVLVFSVMGQLLLVGRRIETWWCWLLVNTIAVPLFTVRGLYVTAILYSAFWINALIGFMRWRRLMAQP